VLPKPVRLQAESAKQAAWPLGVTPDWVSGSHNAAKVGIGAGAGAAVGAILGGGSGAATGAAIGAAAGTGTVLATKGDDVRLEVGSMLETQLTAPLRVLVRIR
jgi:hypothetical protein